MNPAYDAALMDHDFYKVHPEYLPFIGDRFEDFKILQVGESHYVNIGESQETQLQFSLEYFAENWWNTACTALQRHPDGIPETKCWGSWYNTRQVIDRFFKHNQHNYSIFTNPLKVFQEVCLDSQDDTDENFRLKYHYFSFMNFFQMPALYKGESFRKSLRMAAKCKGDLDVAVYEKATEVSADILNHVIKTLKPTAVVFTSSAAWKAYKNHGKFPDNADRPVMVHTAHPGCCWWNRKTRQGISSREHLKATLEKVYRGK